MINKKEREEWIARFVLAILKSGEFDIRNNIVCVDIFNSASYLANLIFGEESK